MIEKTMRLGSVVAGEIRITAQCSTAENVVYHSVCGQLTGIAYL
jgi:hypothetical protein